MNCYMCGTSIDDVITSGKIGFRASCSKCQADLHCCLNCRFYAPGKPNDCLVPGTDYIADRAKNNLCEEFSMRATSSTNRIKKEDAVKRFNDLFKE